MIPVEGHKNLYRDEESNAIVSTDDSSYQDYMNTRRINADKKAEMNEKKKEIEAEKLLLQDLANKIEASGNKATDNAQYNEQALKIQKDELAL